jgi:flap endonuclease-1
MGIKLSDIVEAEKRALSDFSNQKIAIDGYIVLYQFITSIRTGDGQMLTDFQGRPVSHLKGILSRTSRLVGEGIQPVYVFDGKPHPLKQDTLDSRRAIKEAAAVEYKVALEKGDMERARVKAAQTSKVTKEMVEQAKTLLEYMGIPYVQAPGEGEAQAAYMAKKGDVWACASQDFDALLFGSPRLVRNMTSTGRRKLPGVNRYINVEPEYIDLEMVLNILGINQAQLIDMSLLIGTDFNPGIKGVGPKTALKLIKEFDTLEEVLKEKGYCVEHATEVRGIFHEPDVTDEYELKWNMTNDVKLKEFLCGEFGFGEEGVSRSLEALKEFKTAAAQRSLDQFF